MKVKNTILTKEAAARKLERLALEVAEHLNGDDSELIIIGIKNNGLVIANNIAALAKKYIATQIHVISASLDKKNPSEVDLSEKLNFDNKNILICDDVANSGKTLMYALKPLLHAHPKRIQILVLVERMHKQFPIKPDYVGLSVATTLEENIQVEVIDGEVEGAYLQ
jgi:pyrimidine operon attenuation protein/uracil phosphoribosyltransferase